ncbi:MAG: hypothetical protein ACQES7_04255 [Pseudomonadota bacterium]
MAKVPGRYPDWPPTLPQFLACCAPQPEDFGAPSVEAAWHEARNHAMQAGSHAWSHDAVVVTGRKIGWGDIHRASGEFARELKRTFKAEYARTVDALAQGQPLLEHDAAKPPSHAAELKTEADAEQQAQVYQGINGPQALKLMRAMTGGNHNAE